jgi:hypothetical protein
MIGPVLLRLSDPDVTKGHMPSFGVTGTGFEIPEADSIPAGARKGRSCCKEVIDLSAVSIV